MLTLNKTKFAEYSGCSKRTIYMKIANGDLVVRPDGNLDIENPVNQDFLRYQHKLKGIIDNGPPKNGDPLKTPKPRKAEREARKAMKEAGITTREQRLNKKEGTVAQATQVEKPKPDDYLETLDVTSLDIGTLTRADVERLKIIEQIKQLQIKTERDRNLLVSRETCQKVFARLYNVHVNEFRTMGMSLSNDLATVACIDDPATVIKFAEHIEKEVFKTLRHIKRIIDKFLEEIGADSVEG
jgi:hypothetical protein